MNRRRASLLQPATDASHQHLLKAEIESQFVRLRDGDRLFYRSAAAGLYDQGGVLLPEIGAIVDLDSLRLSDILLANSALTELQENVFFVPAGGDFNRDGLVDGADFLAWQRGETPLPLSAPDLNEWRAAIGATGQAASVVPEPATWMLLVAAVASFGFSRKATRIMPAPSVA